MWGLWWTKRHWGRFSPNTSVSPANHHSTNFSIIILTRGWHNRLIGGRSAEWNQLDSTPHYTNYKNIPKPRLKSGTSEQEVEVLMTLENFTKMCRNIKIWGQNMATTDILHEACMLFWSVTS
jgi:hypothetical protein